MERKGASRVPSWGKREKEWQMLANPIGKEVSKAPDSSKPAAEIAQQSPTSKLDADLRELQQSHMTLAENEAWLDKNSDKLISE
jgi:hypothetical protein